ncbi:hypothetical protein JST97_14135 [bacterium]|nr:hypothetical protein [bacterium]
MEVERSLHHGLKMPALSPKAFSKRVSSPQVVAQEQLQCCENHESLACRLLFRRLPELLSRLVSSSSEPGQVTLVFRLGYFDLAGLSQARKEFYRETQAGLRIMVEVPDEQTSPKLPPAKKSLQLKVTQANLKQLARRAAATVQTERVVKLAKNEATAGLAVRGAMAEAAASESALLRNLSLVVGSAEERKSVQSQSDPLSNLRLRSRFLTRPKKASNHAAGPRWLRRQQLILQQQRQIGPKATQNAHSAERQPHCLCPGCGREMISTLLYCPECTMRSARYIQIPAPHEAGRQRQGLVHLLVQAVSCR